MEEDFAAVRVFLKLMERDTDHFHAAVEALARIEAKLQSYKRRLDAAELGWA